MNWSNDWSHPTNNPAIQQANVSAAIPTNPFDALNQDELLFKHQKMKEDLEVLKAHEMELRKYIVSRVFPKPNEGMNTLELGAGYELKATVKYHYNLDASNDKIEAALDRIAKIGNRGPIVAERLISWTPAFLLTEYRLLQEEKDTSAEAKAILQIVNEILVITDAAPTLAIKEPKKGKGK